MHHRLLRLFLLCSLLVAASCSGGGRATSSDPDNSSSSPPYDTSTPYVDLGATAPSGGGASAPVPEPSTMLLFGSGLVAASWLRRRKTARPR